MYTKQGEWGILSSLWRTQRKNTGFQKVLVNTEDYWSLRPQSHAFYSKVTLTKPLPMKVPQKISRQYVPASGQLTCFHHHVCCLLTKASPKSPFSQINEAKLHWGSLTFLQDSLVLGPLDWSWERRSSWLWKSTDPFASSEAPQRNRKKRNLRRYWLLFLFCNFEKPSLLMYGWNRKGYITQLWIAVCLLYSLAIPGLVICLYFWIFLL